MLTNNKNVLTWVDQMVALCKPAKVVWIDGSEEQLNALRMNRYLPGGDGAAES